VKRDPPYGCWAYARSESLVPFAAAFLRHFLSALGPAGRRSRPPSQKKMIAIKSARAP